MSSRIRFLGVAGYEIWARTDEAALAAEMLGVEIAIASHYLRPTPDPS